MKKRDFLAEPLQGNSLIQYIFNGFAVFVSRQVVLRTQSAFATLGYTIFNLIFLDKKSTLRFAFLRGIACRIFCFRRKLRRVDLNRSFILIFYKLYHVFYFAIQKRTNSVQRFHFNVLVGS